MDIAVDRRRFLIAGSAAITALATGSAYLWWDLENTTQLPADDAIRVIPGANGSSIAAPLPTAPQPVPSDVPDAPDRDTEAQLSRLMEDDAANSRQRMLEREGRQSDAPPPIPAESGDGIPATWGP